jgi:hypothetical protein
MTDIGTTLIRDLLGLPYKFFTTGCSVCGDEENTAEYSWKNTPDMTPGILCEDCAGIQQSMYGYQTNDTLIKH